MPARSLLGHASVIIRGTQGYGYGKALVWFSFLLRSKLPRADNAYGMPWLFFVVLVVVLLALVLVVRPSNYVGRINFGGRQQADLTLMRGAKDDVTELAQERPPKDLAP